MLPGITPALFGGVRADPLVVDDYVSLLMHFDVGAEAGNIWSDYSLKTQKGAATAQGNAQLQGPVGGFFQGIAYFDGTGDYAQFPAHADYNMGSGDFTIDCWFYVGGGNGTYRCMVGQADASATAASCSFTCRLGNDNKLYSTFNQGSVATVISGGGAAVTAPGWHHYALVRNGGTMTHYLDGVASGSVAISGAINSSAYKLSIGSIGEYMGGQFWFGWLNELRISKGIARWTANFTPPNAPYKYASIGGNDSFTKLLIHGDTYNGNHNITDFSLSDKGGANGAVTAQLSQGAAKFGSSSLYLSGGAGDAWTVPAHTDFDFGAGDFTIDFWAAVGSYSSHLGLFARRILGDSNNCYQFYFNNTGQAQFVVIVGGTTQINVVTAVGAAPAGEGWAHWAVVRNGNNWRIYKNGVMVGEQNSSSLTIPAFSGNFNIGTAAGGVYPFNGYIDEFRVSKGIARWTSDFTPPKAPYGPDLATSGNDQFTVLMLHFDGNYTDVCRGAVPHVFTAGGSPGFAGGKFGSSFNTGFTTTDRITCPNSTDFDFGAGDFCIDMWLYRASTPQATLIAKRASISNYAPFAISDSGSGALVLYATSANGAWNIASAFALGNMPLNAWTHFALTRAQGTWRSFLNGTQQNTFTNGASLYVNNDALSIGGNAEAGTSAPYLFDEIRVSKGIARWTANFTPPTAPYS